MKRGVIWFVNFEPSIGGEINKQRPAVIVSNDVSNKYMNRVQVVLVSSSIMKLYPSEEYITIRGNQNKAICDQIATVSKKRLINYIDTVSYIELNNVEKAIKIQLDLQ